MITLEQIKNKVCQKYGMQTYTDFLYTCQDMKLIDEIIKEIVYLSQKECLKIASEKYIIQELPRGNYEVLPKNELTNENNIIK